MSGVLNRASTDLRQIRFWGPTPKPGERLVAFIREPALAVWQATKCLAEIHARTDAPDISKIIAEAEIILIGLVLALARRSEISRSTPALANGKASSGVSAH
jgi:hypothetical protein